MIHIVEYITRYGRPMNYDGCRGEKFGKLKIKDNYKFPNKDKETHNYDIGCRMSEQDIVDQISTVSFQNKGYIRFESIVMRQIVYSIQTGKTPIYTIIYFVTYLNK